MRRPQPPARHTVGAVGGERMALEVAHDRDRDSLHQAFFIRTHAPSFETITRCNTQSRCQPIDRRQVLDGVEESARHGERGGVESDPSLELGVAHGHGPCQPRPHSLAAQRTASSIGANGWVGFDPRGSISTHCSVAHGSGRGSSRGQRTRSPPACNFVGSLLPLATPQFRKRRARNHRWMEMARGNCVSGVFDIPNDDVLIRCTGNDASENRRVGHAALLSLDLSRDRDARGHDSGYAQRSQAGLKEVEHWRRSHLTFYRCDKSRVR